MFNVIVARSRIIKLNFNELVEVTARTLEVAQSRVVINPRRMHEGYYSRSVCLSAYLSINLLTATYLVCESQAWCYKILYGVLSACIVWILLKMLCSPVLSTFARDCYLPP